MNRRWLRENPSSSATLLQAVVQVGQSFLHDPADSLHQIVPTVDPSLAQLGEPDARYGIISRFAPGTKENGSFFGHSSRWRIWAECFTGRGDKAYEVLRKMSPITRHEADPDLYRIEPYVACQFIYAPESGHPGEGSHSWATGTAAWTLSLVWEWILGVRPEVDGLRIDPCLPSHWTHARMTRPYRGAIYEFEFAKPAGICKGPIKILLDSLALEGNLLRPQGDGKTHRVQVTIG